MNWTVNEQKRRVTAKAHELPKSNEWFSYLANGTRKRDAPDSSDGGVGYSDDEVIIVGEKSPDQTLVTSCDDDQPAPRTIDPSVERRAKRRREPGSPPGDGTVLFLGESGDGAVSDDTKISDLDELESYYANEEVPRWEHAFEVFTGCDFSPKHYWTVYKRVHLAAHYNHALSRERLNNDKMVKGIVHKLSLIFPQKATRELLPSEPHPWLEKKPREFMCTVVLDVMRAYVYCQFGLEYTRLSKLIEEFDDEEKMRGTTRTSFDWHVLEDAESQTREELAHMRLEDITIKI